MWTNLVVVRSPSLDDDDALSSDRSHSTLRHSSRNLPLKLSSAPFCQGLPGSITAVSTPASVIQRRIACDTNSGPLSDRLYRGAP